MIEPEKIAEAAKMMEDENWAFRIYLKTHADPDELDKQFRRLHEELFSKYDCNACRNCCKQFYGTLSEEDLSRCAGHLGMDPEEFKTKYFVLNPAGTYETKHKPCDFLQEDGSCLLGDSKPEDCADFPFTNRPDRIGSLIGIVENISVCPVLFEIMEQLKKEYHFVYRPGKRMRARDFRR